MEDYETLRKKTRVRLVNLNLDRCKRDWIAEQIKANPNAVSMALTGYRRKPSSHRILTAINDLLDRMHGPGSGGAV
jgi:hypothetical protein